MQPEIATIVPHAGVVRIEVEVTFDDGGGSVVESPIYATLIREDISGLGYLGSSGEWEINGTWNGVSKSVPAWPSGNNTIGDAHPLNYRTISHGETLSWRARSVGYPATAVMHITREDVDLLGPSSSETPESVTVLADGSWSSGGSYTPGVDHQINLIDGYTRVPIPPHV